MTRGGRRPRRARRSLPLFALGLTLLAGCEIASTPTSGSPVVTARSSGADTRTAVAPAAGPRQLVRSPGPSSFSFDPSGALAGQRVTVYVQAPEDCANATILVVMPGQNRNAQDYRADWQPMVAGRNVLVLVPEFAETDFPGPDEYNLGNLLRSDGKANPSDSWTYRIVEQLFDAVVADVGGHQAGYRIFGHSAGAQFVHRLLMLIPENRVTTAVVANAGWYTMPDDNVDFPYGLRGVPTDERDLRTTFAKDMVVLLGAEDTDPDSSSMRQDEPALAQGPYRLARGLTFYRSAADAAVQHGFQLRWRLVTVPGVAHDHTEMGRAAAAYLIGP